MRCANLEDYLKEAFDVRVKKTVISLAVLCIAAAVLFKIITIMQKDEERNKDIDSQVTENKSIIINEKTEIKVNQKVNNDVTKNKVRHTLDKNKLKKDYSESTMEDVPEVALFATWGDKEEQLKYKKYQESPNTDVVWDIPSSFAVD